MAKIGTTGYTDAQQAALYFARKRRRARLNAGPIIALSNRSIGEDADVGDIVGNLSVTNGSGVYTFSLTDDAGGKFALDGSVLEVADALDYETATSHVISVEADNGVDPVLARSFTILVANVAEAGPALRRNKAGLPFLPLTPSVTPNVDKDAAWRQQVGWGYSGIAPAAFVTLSIVLGSLVSPLVQRAAASEFGPIPIVGTYTGDPPPSIQARILLVADDSVIVDWTEVASPAGGTFQGSITAPQGGPYYRQIRCTHDHDLSDEDTTEVSVGAWVNGGGQSNMNGIKAQTGGSPPAASAGTFFYDDEGTQEVIAVPNIQPLRTLANGLRATFGCPVGIFFSAKNGASIAELQQGNAQQNYETIFEPNLAAIGGDFELTIFWQGESDTGSNENLDTMPLLWQQRRATLHGQYAAAAGRTLAQQPMIVCGLGSNSTGSPTLAGNRGWSRIQDAIRDSHDPSGHVYYSHSSLDFAHQDALHVNLAGYTAAAERFLQTVGFVYGEESARAAWQITGAEAVDGTTTTVDVTHELGADFTPSSGITGFEVSDDGGASWATATAARTDANTITLTHSALGLTRLVAYQRGLNPDVSDLVLDDSSLELPLAPAATGIQADTDTPDPRSTFLGAVSGLQHNAASSAILIGPAAADRFIVGFTCHRDTRALASGTINPTEQSPVAVSVLENEQSNGLSMSWFSALVPAGTEATFTPNFGGNVANTGGVALWSIPADTLNSTTPVDVQSATADNTNDDVAVSVDQSSGGLTLVGAIQQGNSHVHTLGGDLAYAQRRERGMGAAQMVVGDRGSAPDSDPTSVLVSSNGADEIGISAITFR
jgi:hypothetical protein